MGAPVSQSDGAFGQHAGHASCSTSASGRVHVPGPMAGSASGVFVGHAGSDEMLSTARGRASAGSQARTEMLAFPRLAQRNALAARNTPLAGPAWSHDGTGSSGSTSPGISKPGG